MKKSELKQMIREILEEDLRNWFKKKWVNIGKKDKDGKHPPCGTSGDKRGYAKCVPQATANKMTDKEKESATRRKKLLKMTQIVVEKIQQVKERNQLMSALTQNEVEKKKWNRKRIMNEEWSNDYKKKIDCSNPKGFSQKAHCAGRKKRQAGKQTKSKPVKEKWKEKH